MRRIIRWLWNGFTVVSLLLCMAAVMLWVRSNDVADGIEWIPERPGSQVVGTIVKFASSSGGMDFEVHSLCVDAPIDPSTRRSKWEENQTAPGLTWQKVLPWSNRLYFFDFFWLNDHGVRDDPHLSDHKFFVAIPYWAVIVLSLLVPAGRLGLRLWKRRHHSPGHCRQCGYDLRATPDRCPECGTAVRVKVAS